MARELRHRINDWDNSTSIWWLVYATKSLAARDFGYSFQQMVRVQPRSRFILSAAPIMVEYFMSYPLRLSLVFFQNKYLAAENTIRFHSKESLIPTARTQMFSNQVCCRRTVFQSSQLCPLF